MRLDVAQRRPDRPGQRPPAPRSGRRNPRKPAPRSGPTPGGRTLRGRGSRGGPRPERRAGRRLARAACAVAGSPAWKPQATLADVISAISSASWGQPSPRSQFRSMGTAHPVNPSAGRRLPSRSVRTVAAPNERQVSHVGQLHVPGRVRLTARRLRGQPRRRLELRRCRPLRRAGGPAFAADRRRRAGPHRLAGVAAALALGGATTGPGSRPRRSATSPSSPSSAWAPACSSACACWLRVLDILLGAAGSWADNRAFLFGAAWSVAFSLGVWAFHGLTWLKYRRRMVSAPGRGGGETPAENACVAGEIDYLTEEFGPSPPRGRPRPR